MPLYGSAGALQPDRWLSGGHYAAVAGDASADKAEVPTGLAKLDSWMVQVYRANVQVTGDAKITVEGGTIVVEDGNSTYAVTSGDIIRFIAWGTK